MRFKRRYRIRRRTYRRPPQRQFLLIITLIIFVVSMAFSFWIINDKIEPIVKDIAKRKTEEFATRAINSAVAFVGEYSLEDIIDITYDNEGNVVTYNQNPTIMSEINRVATDRVEEFFVHVNEGKPLSFENNLEEPLTDDGSAEGRVAIDPTLIEIPLGQVTGNSVLSNLGPKIPINMQIIGNVRTNIIRETEEFGINGSWVTLYINVEADVQIIVPFTSDVTTVHTELYLDSSAIMGKVPDFYGGDGSPDIAIPKDDLQND